MSDRQVKALRSYLYRLKRQMWMSRWRIDIMHEPPDDENAIADIEATYGREVASLRVCSEFFTLEPDVQRHVLVHELLHCPTDDLLQHARALCTPLGSAHGGWMHAFRLSLEHFIDTMALVIEDNLPLPRLPKS